MTVLINKRFKEKIKRNRIVCRGRAHQYKKAALINKWQPHLFKISGQNNLFKILGRNKFTQNWPFWTLSMRWTIRRGNLRCSIPNMRTHMASKINITDPPPMTSPNWPLHAWKIFFSKILYKKKHTLVKYRMRTPPPEQDIGPIPINCWIWKGNFFKISFYLSL